MIRFNVIGAPQTQGSKKTIPHAATGRPITIESMTRTKPWRVDVAEQARAACASGDGRSVVMYPKPHHVDLALIFRFALAKRWRTAIGVSQHTPLKHAGAPDVDKLSRAILDALTAAGCIYEDDGQVASLYADKIYVAPGGWTGCTVIAGHEATILDSFCDERAAIMGELLALRDAAVSRVRQPNPNRKRPAPTAQDDFADWSP